MILWVYWKDVNVSMGVKKSVYDSKGMLKDVCVMLRVFCGCM